MEIERAPAEHIEFEKSYLERAEQKMKDLEKRLDELRTRNSRLIKDNGDVEDNGPPDWNCYNEVHGQGASSPGGASTKVTFSYI